MKIIDCPREHEAMTTVASGQWPDGCADELRAHIAACAICSDVLEVARAVHDDHEAVESKAQISPAGLVWWRAELKARQEAMRTASRPMTLVQAFGAASGIGMALGLVSLTWPWLREFLSFSLFPWSLVIAFALAILLIAPLAMYFVLSDE
jgi:hypothetical protein